MTASLLDCGQCPKITILLGCRSGKFRPPKRQGEWKIWSKMGYINLIDVENSGYFSVMAFMAVLWQSLLSKHQLRVGN